MSRIGNCQTISSPHRPKRGISWWVYTIFYAIVLLSGFMLWIKTTGMSPFRGGEDAHVTYLIGQEVREEFVTVEGYGPGWVKFKNKSGRIVFASVYTLEFPRKD